MDIFDCGTAFVADTVGSLASRMPALSKALKGLAADMQAGGQHHEHVMRSSKALADALGSQLDELRLQADACSADGRELSAALTAVALVGAVACTRSSQATAAVALLDGALLRARDQDEAHKSLLHGALSVLDDVSLPAPKRQRAHHWGHLSDPAVAPPAVSLPSFGSAVSSVARGSPELTALVKAASAPAVIPGLASEWPALERWADPQYLLTVAGQRLVPIEVGASHLVDSSGGGVCAQQVLCTMSDFIGRCVLSGQTATRHDSQPSAVSATVPVTAARTRGYLAQHRLFDQVPALGADIKTPGVVPPHADSRAWFGPPGVSTPVHYDHHHGMLVQVFGYHRSPP